MSGETRIATRARKSEGIAKGYHLRGVMFDKMNASVELMLGSATDAAVHLTRAIPKVSSLAVTRIAGDQSVLRIKHGMAVTLLTAYPAT